MKTSIIIGIILLVVVLGILGFQYLPWIHKNNTSWLKNLRYSQGDWGWSYGYHYDIKFKNGIYLLTFEQTFPESDKKEKNLTSDEVQQIETILVKGDFAQRNGFDENDTNVMDGSSWSLHYTYKDWEEIKAHGYESYPHDFSKISMLTSYLDELLQNEE